MRDLNRIAAMSAVRLFLLMGACLALPLAAGAINNPPYEVYPYLSDDGDVPPVNYTKVCEPGRTGETNASYVVLGISFPRTYQAIAGDFDGDLVIPARIDGLPVRKIEDSAFLACTKLRSVSIPATVREIGERAFAECWQLTNVTFASGVNGIGDAAFSNCVSLVSIRFPQTLARLGAHCFQGCVSLTDVHFDGNAPRLAASRTADTSVLGESIFRQTGYGERFRVHIRRDTYGWVAPYEKGVPEKWPMEFGFMQAHEVVAEPGGTESGAETGFVTVVTEVRGGAVAIPESWAQRYPGYEAMFGKDFTASLVKQTGKTDADGNDMFVWQDYVAGTDPTDVNDRFRATIRMEDGVPVVECSPQLPESEGRKYTIWGKVRLSDAHWREVASNATTECNFFKVTVEMR